MLNKLFAFFLKKSKTPLIKNSFWGITSNVSQNLLFSAVFVIIARKYSTDDFGSYVLANTLYAFVVAFSSLGLGQWFIRELMNTEDKKVLINKFFKMQLYIGVFFYVINIAASYTLYDSTLIRSLSLLVGTNVIFDNVIYVIRQINIAQSEQRKTFIILTIEAVLKFLIALLLFVFPMSILTLSLLLIILRFVTLNLFIQIGSSNLVNLRQVLKVRVGLREIGNIIVPNYPFIVIGSISVVYWRIGNILVSKILTLKDVTNYDISLKLWSIAVILPVIVSSSVFPLLVKSLKNSKREMQCVYKKGFIIYGLFGLMAYTFVYSFSDFLIPFLFGEKYVATPQYCKEMFLTILLFPTALLQANVLISMKLEKLDMLFNLTSLIVYLLLVMVGFLYFKSLSVINYGIFFSFLVFHVLQDITLLKRKVTKIGHVLLFYGISIISIISYQLLCKQFNSYGCFVGFWSLIFATIIVLQIKIPFLKTKLVEAVS